MDITRRKDIVAAVALMFLYTALMSGHFQSIDGLLMFDQARSILYNHTLVFREAILWGGEIFTSKYGLGLSLLYLPGLAVFSWLQPLTHQAVGNFDWGIFYIDPVYAVAGAPVQVAITAATAYLVSRFCRKLGLGDSGAVWGLIVFGIGSPALVYARGDLSQPLEGLCWIGALYSAVCFGTAGSRRDMLLCAGTVLYAVLTRPAEGSLLFLSVMAILQIGPWDTEPGPKSPWPRLAVVLAFGAGILITALTNYGRYGRWYVSGYEGEGWTTPILVGVSGLLVSPARGLLWAFPSTLLVPIGVWHLWHTQHRNTGLAILALIVADLLLVGTWDMWWGGWNWGPRLIAPAFPLLAILSVLGASQLGGKYRGLILGTLVVVGLISALPGVAVDLFAGYGALADGSNASFRLQAFPPLSAWKFIHHWFASSPTDGTAVDILWFRLYRSTRGFSLVPFLACLVGAASLTHWHYHLSHDPDKGKA